MYEQFYGLSENPFRVTPDPKFLYLGKHHREALAQMLCGVGEKKGFVVITGEVGTGKTTLIHCLLDELNGSDKTKTALLFNPKLDAKDFLQYIIEDLGIQVNGKTKGDYLHALYRYLLDAYGKEERVVLVVDEAQGLNPELLEEIRLLSNLETSKSKLLQIVLAGQPELNKTLWQPRFRQLRQRINMRYHLEPLSEGETKEYIEKRLNIAGAAEPIFLKKAIKEIHMRSGGIPRLINILCDNALLNGYALDQKVVDTKLVKEVAKDLNLKTNPTSPWIWAILFISIFGVVLLVAFLDQRGYLLPLYSSFLKVIQNLRETVLKVFQNVFRYFN